MKSAARKNFRYLLAVDPSLSASGWVLFEICSQEPLAAGVISPPGPETALAERMNELQQSVELLFKQLCLGVDDILVCEGPAPLVTNPESSLKVERVRSIFESVARTHGATVPGRLNPRTVQTEVLGMRGKQLSRREVKEWAREAGGRLFGPRLLEAYKKSGAGKRTLPQDVIDAALIGFLAVSKVKLAIQCDMELSTMFLGKVASRDWGSQRRSSGWTEADFAKASVK